jgi:hypothetical protein
VDIDGALIDHDAPIIILDEPRPGDYWSDAEFFLAESGSAEMVCFLKIGSKS